MGEIIEQYGIDQDRRGLTDQTQGCSRRLLHHFAREYGGDIAQASTNEVADWLDSCVISSRSRITYLAQLRGFYRYCRRAGLRQDDPIEDIARPKSRRLLPRPIADDDLGLAMQLASPMMAAWLALAAYQGFRAIEVARLLREDILERHDPPLIVARGKGDKEAPLPLHPEVLRLLKVAGLPLAGYVFLLPRDRRPFPGGTVSVYANRYLHGLGISDTFHQLRHWYGTSVFKKTRDLRLTQELMRHAGPGSTAIYTAWSPIEAADAVLSLSVSGGRMA
jgi:integrase